MLCQGHPTARHAVPRQTSCGLGERVAEWACGALSAGGRRHGQVGVSTPAASPGSVRVPDLHVKRRTGAGGHAHPSLVRRLPVLRGLLLPPHLAEGAQHMAGSLFLLVFVLAYQGASLAYLYSYALCVSRVFTAYGCHLQLQAPSLQAVELCWADGTLCLRYWSTDLCSSPWWRGLLTVTVTHQMNHTLETDAIKTIRLEQSMYLSKRVHVKMEESSQLNRLDFGLVLCVRDAIRSEFALRWRGGMVMRYRQGVDWAYQQPKEVQQQQQYYSKAKQCKSTDTPNNNL